MNQKTTTIIGLLTIAIVITSTLTYLAFVNAIEYGEITAVAIIAIIIALALYVFHDRAKNAAKGLPHEDERLKLANYKACYYGFITAIWTAVFSPVITDLIWNYEPPGHIISALVVLISGAAFVISYLYLSRKGTLT
jgi:hypothetical protein